MSWSFNEYRRLKKLLQTKQQGLFELEQDILFFERVKNAHSLEKQIKDLRESLASEQRKDEKKRSSDMIQDLSFRIAELDKVRQQYELTKLMRRDMEAYVNMLEKDLLGI